MKRIFHQYTFQEIDSLQIHPIVIVIPNLSDMKREKQDPALVRWIDKHKSDTRKVLEIYAGSVAVAATGV